jgi:Pentapeptide repeats (8 copies)
VRSQEHQQNEANGKDLAEDTNTRSSKGTEKRRERFAGWLGESSGVQILSFASQAAAVITVIVAALTYFWEAPEREKEKHYQAWQAINTAQGQGGSGGRKEALQDLNDDKQSLVSLTVPDAFLKGIDLVGAELDYANFTRATLTGANLREASLKGADLRNVNMGDSASDDTGNANLEGANLENADAREADLSGRKLSRS